MIDMKPTICSLFRNMLHQKYTFLTILLGSYQDNGIADLTAIYLIG